jgi:hypothetical protein
MERIAARTVLSAPDAANRRRGVEGDRRSVRIRPLSFLARSVPPGYTSCMESIIRDVKSLESQERQAYELLLGHALQENQRVVVMILNPGAEPDEPVRRKAREEFHDLCREGTEHRQRLAASVEEADQALDEAIRAGRSRKTE